MGFRHPRCKLFLLSFIALSHLHKPLIGDFALNVRLIQTLNRLVYLLNAALSILNGGTKRLQFCLSAQTLLLRHQVEEHRLIAANEIGQVADSFQHDLFQYDISDIVDFAFSTPVFIVGAAPELLIAFQAFGSAEMEFCSAVRAEHQAGKQAFSACRSRSALVLP